MIQVTQSPFLQALGYAIVNSLWQFALLWLVYLLVNSVFKLSANRRYATALLLQLTGFVWFVVTIFYYYQYCVQLASDISALRDYSYYLAPYAPVTFKEKAYALLMQAELLLPYLSLAYMLLLIFLSVKVCRSYQQMITIRKTGLTKIDVNWRLFVQQLSYQLGIKQPVRIYLSKLVQSPVTIGFFKPLVLLPVAAISNLNTEQVEAILLHELAHIKRHDYLVNLLVSVIEVALFFNPFMQLISRHIKRERENSCDDWVLQYQYNAATYAKALLKIATAKSTHTTQFAIGAVDNKRALLIRVKRMIEKNDRTCNYRQQLIALLFMTSIFITVAWFAPAKTNIKSQQGDIAKKTLEIPQPLLAKTTNPLFNPVFFLAKPKKEKIAEQTLSALNKMDNNFPVLEEVEPLQEQKIEADKNYEKAQNIYAAAFNPVEEVPITAANIDTAQLFKEMRSIFTTRSFTSAEWKLMQKQLLGMKKELLTKSKFTWQSLFDSEKAQKEVQSALDHLSQIKLQLHAQGKNIIVLGAKEREKMKDAESAAEEKRVYKNMELQAVAEKVRSQIEAIKALELLMKKSQENFSFTYEMPAVLTTVEKPVTSYSYEYKERPKTPIVIAATPNPCPCTVIKTQHFEAPGIEVEINESIKEVQKPSEVKKIIKTKVIVHI